VISFDESGRKGISVVWHLFNFLNIVKLFVILDHIKVGRK